MVEPKAHGQWYTLVTDNFLPLLKSQPLFKRVTFSRVLSDSVENHYIYSVLIEIDTMEGYELYQNELIQQYVDIAKPMFETKVTHFVTVMKNIE